MSQRAGIRNRTFVTLFVSVILLGQICFAKYSGGSGTATNPYRIARTSDLLKLAADTNDYDAYFVLTKDIDLGPCGTFTTAVIAPDIDNSNDYFDGTPFTGVFDGAGHKIYNLTINTNGVRCDYSDYLGLFGSNGLNSQIKNLGLQNVRIITGAQSQRISALVGENNEGNITNCFSTGTIVVADNAWDVGGLVGHNEVGNINSCYSTVVITGGENAYSIGGLVGSAYEGTISDCHAMGDVSSVGDDSSAMGGLVGYNIGSDIIRCYATGDIAGGDYVSDAGGLVGDNEGDINNCYSTGSVSGSYEIAGLVSQSYGSISNSYSTGSVSGSGNVGGLVAESYGSISNCYSAGSVSGSIDSPDDYDFPYVGGLVAYNEGHINNCYSTGSVSGSFDFSDSSDSLEVGGLVGYNDGPISNCYSMGSVSGSADYYVVGGLVGDNEDEISNCYSTGSVSVSSSESSYVGGLIGGSYRSIVSSYFLITSGPDNGLGTPLTESLMKKQSSFVGWDFVGETANGLNDIWTICEGFDYPKLAGAPLVISQCVVKAGNTDYISISGRMTATSNVFDEAKSSGNTNFVKVTISSDDMDPCVITFHVNNKTWKRGRFDYCGTANGIKKSFSYNVKTGKFAFAASNINLSGLECPLTIDINVGDYTGTTEIDETIVNGRRPIPIKLLMGVKDSLRVDKSKFTRDRNTYNITKVAIRGGFSDKNVNDTNLVNNPLDITVGSHTFTIPADNFDKVKRKFTCSKVKLYDGATLIGIATATFDFSKCTFSLTIKNTNFIDSGTVDFDIDFATFSGSDEVTLPP
ncbi:MAG: GLUG motif-containing protein [Sedimentisphaerales bacterium]|jgi:hypothetical protein